jgi:hypothetical protein
MRYVRGRLSFVPKRSISGSKSAATSRARPDPFQGPSSYPKLLVVADCKLLPVLACTQPVEEIKMEVKEAIAGRLSIRRYAESSIPPDHMETLFRAAQLAPSASNGQN